MRIIEVIPSLKLRAGAEVFSVDLSCNLKEHGNEVLFVCLYDGINESFSNQLLSSSINVIFCGKRKGFDLRCSKRFKRIINDFKPDIVHIHLGCLVTYCLAFGFKKRSWNLVQTIHNIARCECNKINRFLKKIYVKHRLLSLVGISKAITESIIKLYRCKPYTIYNGIRLPNVNSIIHDSIYDLICVARFSIQKNHKLLMDAISKLIHDFNYSNIKCICVGDGPLLADTIGYVSKLNIQKNVLFVGKKDNVYDYLKMSKIFVLSSLYEGNPISILEAMSVGLPVVAPNVGGIPDIIKNNYNGIVYCADNASELAVSLKTLLENETLLNNISLTNRKDALLYSIEMCTKEYNSIFLKMCGAK